MNYVLTAVFAFIFGFLLGWNISLLFSFLVYMAIAYAIVLSVDVAMGIGPRMSSFRARVRVWWLNRMWRGVAANVVPFRTV